MGVVLAVPAEVAESLLSDHLAVRPLRGRAEPEVVAATFEVIGAVANMVTIAVAVPQVRESLKRSLRWALRRTADAPMQEAPIMIRIHLTSGATRTLTLHADDAEIRIMVNEITDGDGGHSVES